MALKVGDLYVAVTTSIGEALVNIGKYVKAVEKAAAQVKAASEPLGQIGAVVAAGIGAAVAAAAESNAVLKEQTEHIKDLLVTLAAELGDLFEPLVKKVSHAIERVVVALQSLSPGMKRAAAGIVGWVAGVGLGVGVVGKLAGALEGVTKGMGLALTVSQSMLKTLGTLGHSAGKAFTAFQALAKLDVGKALAGMTSSLSGLSTTVADFTKSMPSLMGSIGRMALGFLAAAGPILAVAAALAGVALLAGSVYKAWGDIKYIASEAWAGMSRSVAELMAGLSDVALKLANVFGLAFNALAATIEAMVDRSLDFVAFLVRTSAKMLKPIAKAANMSNMEKALGSAETLSGKDFKKGILDALSSGGNAFLEGMSKEASALKNGAVLLATKAGDAAKAAAGAAKDTVGFGLQYAASGLQDMMAAILSSKTVEEWTAKMEELKKLLDSLMNGDAQATLRTGGDAETIDVSEAGHKGTEGYAQQVHNGLPSKAMEGYAEKVEKEAKELAKAIQKAAEDAAKAAAAAKEALISGFLNRLGELGGIIESAKQGFQAGGFWGAVVAAIGELLMGTEEMAGAMEVLNGIIGQLSEIFGAIGKGLQPLLGAVSYLLQVVVDILGPLLEQLGKVLQDISPVIVMIGSILQALTPILGTLLEGLGKALSWLVNNVLRVLFDVLRYVGLAILYVVKGLGSAWNGIISAIQWVFRKLGDISIFGGHPLGFLRDWARGMNSAKVDLDSLAKSIQDLEGLTWDAAMAKARETAEVMKNREALADVNEALSNVPSLWKVALRRFDSQDTQDGPTTPGGAQRPPSTGPASPSLPTPEVLPPVSRGDLPAWLPGIGGLLDLLDRAKASPTAPGNASAAALPGVTYNITGFDLTDAMAKAQADFEDRQRRAGIRLFGTAASVKPRYG